MLTICSVNPNVSVDILYDVTLVVINITRYKVSLDFFLSWTVVNRLSSQFIHSFIHSYSFPSFKPYYSCLRFCFPSFVPSIHNPINPSIQPSIHPSIHSLLIHSIHPSIHSWRMQRLVHVIMMAADAVATNASATMTWLWLLVSVLHCSKLVRDSTIPRWPPDAILNYKKAFIENDRESSVLDSRHLQATFLKKSAF